MNFLLYTIPSLTTKTTDMKVNELRIGNYIQYEHETLHIKSYGRLVTIGMVTATAQATNNSPIYGNDQLCVLEALNPIELTEEVLLKSGFVLAYAAYHEGIAYYNRRIEGWMFQWQSDGWIYVEQGGRDFTMEIELKHLHQLQNLYYALTGEELPITL